MDLSTHNTTPPSTSLPNLPPTLLPKPQSFNSIDSTPLMPPLPPRRLLQRPHHTPLLYTPPQPHHHLAALPTPLAPPKPIQQPSQRLERNTPLRRKRATSEPCELRHRVARCLGRLAVMMQALCAGHGARDARREDAAAEIETQGGGGEAAVSWVVGGGLVGGRVGGWEGGHPG